MARLRHVVVARQPVRRPGWLPARVLSYAWNAGLPPPRILRGVYGIDPAALPRADVVVSAGGDTLAANAAAARLLGVPNVFYGSLRRYRPEDFALVLTSYARNAGRLHHVMALKPSRFDADRLPSPVRTTGAAATLGLLVGGDAGSQFRYRPEDWDCLVTFLCTLHKHDGTRWVVSNSRRTPDVMSDRLAELAAGGAGPIVSFIDVRNPGSGTLESLFAAAEALVVTADSSSMISEGVWIRRPVIALAPRGGVLTPDEHGYRKWLEDSGWLRTIPLDELTPLRLATAMAAVVPLAHNPLDELAGILAQRLPALVTRS